MFEAYFIACLFLMLGPSPKVWVILSLSAAVNIVANLWLDNLETLWLVAVAGSFEFVTICALCKYAPDKGQVILLLISWLTHGMLLMDLTMLLNIVYTHYELLVSTILAVQILLGINGSLPTLCPIHPTRDHPLSTNAASNRQCETVKKG